MKVLVIGANGKIGTILSKKLKQSEHFEPVAMIRQPEQRLKFEQMDIPTVLGDLASNIDELSQTMNEAHAVVFTAGSGGKTGYDKTLEIDLDGAVKSMLAAEKNDIKRYIMVSAAFADEREFWPKSGIKPYYIAKHFADKTLRESSLDYTILRPVRLTDESGNGKIKISQDPKTLENEISRESVADSIVAALKNEKTKSKVFEISDGKQAIETAF